MGNSASGDINKMEVEDIEKIFTFPLGVDERSNFLTKYSGSSLNTYSCVNELDDDFKEVQQILQNGTNNVQLDKAMGSFYGMVIGDALGAPLEFSKVRYNSTELKGFDEEIWNKMEYNSFRLKPGQWTDDASMGLCLSESLLENNGFNPQDLRLRFLNWWELGYCNAFGCDSSQRGTSVGLGGNISQSFSEFTKKKTEYTTAGDKFTSGNGSVMRMCAVPIFFSDSLEKAIEISYKQSKTTHQGDEAAECCSLMSHIIVNSIQKGTKTKEDLNFLESFQPNSYSVGCLKNSKQEEENTENSNLLMKDRNWNWKDINFKFSPTRSQQQPGYIGSYCMDATSMALHCIHSTNSFKEALLKCANMRGDSDSVCSVVGQMAGAIYGLSSIPKEWIETVSRWDKGGLIGLRAYKLFFKKSTKKN